MVSSQQNHLLFSPIRRWIQAASCSPAPLSSLAKQFTRDRDYSKGWYKTVDIDYNIWLVIYIYIYEDEDDDNNNYNNDIDYNIFFVIIV